MITIKKNTINNNVVFTLTENSKLTDPIFVFVFFNDLSHEYVIFSADDLSAFNCRFNRFTIEENNTIDLINGIISLTYTGYWSYKVFETDVLNDINDIVLDKENFDIDIPSATINFLEQGKVYVYEDINDIPSFNPTNDTDTIPAFDI